MRAFPYFLSEGILAFLAAVSLLIPLVAPGLLNYGLALLSLVIFLGFFKVFDSYAHDFGRSVKGIKGLSRWDSDFFSGGSLSLEYLDEKIHYHSLVGSAGKTIPVDYFLRLRNGAEEDFTFTKTADGGFSVSGGQAFYAKAEQEIKRFDSSYFIRTISNADGTLEIDVRLEFEHGPPPSKEEKLEDMTGFLEDYLSFAYLLNSMLKKKHLPKGKSNN